MLRRTTDLEGASAAVLPQSEIRIPTCLTGSRQVTALAPRALHLCRSERLLRCYLGDSTAHSDRAISTHEGLFPADPTIPSGTWRLHILDMKHTQINGIIEGKYCTLRLLIRTACSSTAGCGANEAAKQYAPSDLHESGSFHT